MTTLYDHLGRPVDLQALRQEHAAANVTVRSPWQPSVAGTLTPARLASILQAAADGDQLAYLTLAEEMEEREWHYGSVLSTRKLAVSGRPIIVEAASDDDGDVALADEIRELVALPAFGDLVDDLTDGLGKGYSVVEIMWNRGGSRWEPEQFLWRDPRFFVFDRVTGHELLLRDEASPLGAPIAPWKFVVHKPRLKTGLPIRGGLARRVAVAFMCKAYALKDWMAFAELFGLPLRLGRYGPGASRDDIAKLISAVANLGTDAAAVIPESMRIEFVQSGAGPGGPDLFRGLAEWLDKQTSKAVLGQTMTADDGSSKSQAQVHNDVRLDLQRADARQLTNTLNRDVVKPYIDVNHGVQARYPRVVFMFERQTDLASLPQLIDRGLRVEQSVIRDRLGLPDPADDAELLVPSDVASQRSPGSPEDAPE